MEVKPTAHGFIWKYKNGFTYILPSEVIKKVPDFDNYVVTKDGQVYSTRSKISSDNQTGDYTILNFQIIKDLYTCSVVVCIFQILKV